MKQLSRYSDAVYALMRIVIGLLFAFHGLQKLFGVYSDFQPPMFSQLWIGGVIELAGGLLVAAGFQTRWAAFIASGTMAVAYFQFHWKLKMGGGAFLPAVNQGELAVIYCFVFLYIACRGAGRLSIDRD